MITKPEEAVPWVMRELDFKRDENPRNFEQGWWHPKLKWMSDDEALQHCRSLDVLSEVWTKNKWEFHYWPEHSLFQVEESGYLAKDTQGNNIKRAALIATGRVLEARKEEEK